jgi:uncharacterized membrane protein YgcG
MSDRATGRIVKRASFRAPANRLGRWVGLALVLALAVASPAWAVVPEVQDGGGFFKPETIAKANDALAEMGKKHNKDLLIETYATVPADKVEAVKGMDKEARTSFFQEWANSRARRRRVNGVYVLISKDPAHIQLEVGHETQKVAFTGKDRDHLRDILVAAFEKKEYDRGLLEAVQFVEKTLDENLAHVPVRKK